MAAPFLVWASIGGTDTAGAWTSPTLVCDVIGDLVICQVLQDGATSGAISSTVTTSGTGAVGALDGTTGTMTYIGQFAVGSATVAYQHLWIGRITNTGGITVAGTNSTGEDVYMRVYEFGNGSAGKTLATVIENVTAGSTVTGAATSGTIADASVQTLGPDRLALNFIAINDDNAVAAFTGMTGGLWKEEIAEYAESGGTDGCIQLQTAMEVWKSNTQGTNTFNGVAYGNGYWVTVGTFNELWYKATDPAGAWTSNPQGSTYFNAVAYGNGYWVAVGGSGTLYYKSTDPTGAWTSNTQGSAVFRSVAYANGYWVAVGDSGTLYYKATDPTGAWTSNAQGSNPHYGVAYGNGYWAACGFSGSLYYKATDPTGAWTSNAQGTAQLNTIAYGNGYWCMGGLSAMYYKATNPTGAWTSNAQGSTVFRSVTYDDGYWVGTGQTGDHWFTETDPTGPWVFHNVVGANTHYGVAYGNGYWVAVGVTGELYYNETPPLNAHRTPATINGGTTTNSDAADGWGAVGFALIGNTQVSQGIREARYVDRD